MKKGYSSLILLILFITMGCKSLMRKVYGVENPQIKNISKIQKYLSSEDIDTTKTLVFKNLGAFATATKMEGGLEIPNAYFFNSKGNFVSYKKKAEDCNALIDDFISKSPRIVPSKTTTKTNLAKERTAPPEALMTETLARVYLEQKNYKKAIQAYKILILKNPEKSGFFADQIRAIEKLINTEQQ